VIPSAASPTHDTGQHPLDNPVRSALLGVHRHHAVRQGQVLRYPEDIAPFHAFDAAGAVDSGAWADLATLTGPGGFAVFGGLPSAPPDNWLIVTEVPGVQLVDDDLVVAGTPQDRRPPDGVTLVALGPNDVPQMLALVARTEPGPFRPRTIELGKYVGIRDGADLVAMAGVRMQPQGYAEISAVCTDPAYRGRGYATLLVREVAATIVADGSTPFLHAAASNTNAIRLYQALGFRLRRGVQFVGVQAPQA
jgi:ribosomal protein S18 acetylase RimI-like enzyme